MSALDDDVSTVDQVTRITRDSATLYLIFDDNNTDTTGYKRTRVQSLHFAYK